MSELGVRSSEGRRILDEERVIAQVALRAYGWARALEEGPRGEARALLERWISMGLPFRAHDGRRLFDIAEVENFAQVHDHARYVDVLVAAKRRGAQMFMAPDTSALESGLSCPARFTVTMRRELDLSARSPGTKLRVALPLPCEDRAQTDIVVEPVASAHARMTPTPGVLDVRLVVPEEGRAAVPLEVRIGFTAWLEAFPIDPARLVPYDTASEDYERYTRKDEGLVKVTPFVSELAAALAGDAGPWQTLERYWAFFFDRMQIGRVHHDELDPADPLRSAVELGWGDCMIGAAILVAMFRARGMPARLVNGLTLYPDKPGNHYWAEVLLPPFGWVPLDLASVGLAARDATDTPWSTHLRGSLNYRMKLARLPLTRFMPLGVRYPRNSVLIESPCDGGVENSLLDRYTCNIVYRDRYCVTWQRFG